MPEALASQIVKGGAAVLFLDLKQAKNDTLYLTVTSVGRAQDGQTERRSVRVFGQQIVALRDGLAAIMASDAYVAQAAAPTAA
jgi:hypothetical protein